MVARKNGEFLNWDDYLEFLDDLHNELNRKKVLNIISAKKSDGDELENYLQLRDTVDKLISTFDKKNVYLKDPRDILPPDDANDIWNQFHEALADIYSTEDGRDDYLAHAHDDFPWGIWASRGEGGSKEITIEENVGLTDNTKTVLSTRMATTLHDYRVSPPEINPWRLQKAVQGKYSFFVGVAKAKEIDAVCSVPSMDNIESLRDGAKWILDSDTLTQTWQRKMSINRVQSIANFAESSNENSIINSIILYVPPDAKGVYVDEDSGEVRFKFEEFLTVQKTKHSRVYRDYAKNHNEERDEDFRPIWILDGQHRTRGLSVSARGSNLMLPIILLLGGKEDDRFSLGDAAKLFTEINTLNKILNKEMQYMLGQRFLINGSNSDNDWGDPEEIGISEKIKNRRRANHLGYKTALHMGSRKKGSPLSGGIQFFGGKKSGKARYTIQVWMGLFRKLTGKNGIYSFESDLTDKQIQKEIENYFTAIQNTFNYNTKNKRWEKSPKQNRWVSDRGRNTSLAEHKIQCKNILLLLPTVIDLVDESVKVRPYTISQFESVLKPLRNVDWLEKPLTVAYKGGGEQRRTAMLSWMIDTLRYVNPSDLPSPEDILNKSNYKNKPGTGIISIPGETTFKTRNNHRPTADKKTEFVFDAPRNCWRGEKELTSLELNILNNENEPSFTCNLLGKTPDNENDFADINCQRDNAGNQTLHVKLTNISPLLIVSANSFRFTGSWKNELGAKEFEILVKKDDI